MLRLQQRYLLVAPIPFNQDPQGRIWLDQLWHLDLIAHLNYLAHLTVLAPCRKISVPEPGMVEVRPPEGARLSFRALHPHSDSALRALLSLPGSIRNAWGAIGQADLVHSGVAGWPIPPGVIVNPIALLRRRPLIVVIESAFWRLQKGQRASWKHRLRATLTEMFARWTLRHAALAVYTNREYRDSLPVGPRGTSLILPASWISEADIISPEMAQTAWSEKPQTPRFLMASRLVKEKGVPLFLDALRNLEATGQSVSIDVIGSGPLRKDIEEFAVAAEKVRIRLLEPVPYGSPFFELVRGYHAVVVPTTGDEQPRILYDAFSQAVPVIATATAGNLEIVEDGKNGWVVPENSADDLARALTDLSQQPSELRRMGQAALAVARDFTHITMHERRAESLLRIFGPAPN